MISRIKSTLKWYHPDLSDEGDNFVKWQYKRGMQAVRAGSVVTVVIPIVFSLFWLNRGPAMFLQAFPFILLGILGYTATFIPFFEKRIVGLSALAILVLGQAMAWGLDEVISFPRIEIIFAPVTLLIIVVATTPIKPIWLFIFTVSTILSMYTRNYMANYFSLAEMPNAVHFEYFKLFLLGMLAVTVRAVIMNTQIKMHRSAESVETTLEQLQSAHGRLVQAEKITSQAQLAAAVSHEVNNPLGVVKSNNQTIQSIIAKLKNLKGDNAESVKEEMHKLTELLTSLTDTNQLSVNRIEELTAKLKRFTNLDRGEIQNVNVTELLKDSADLLNNDVNMRDRTTITGENEIIIKGNPAEFSELFTQLIKNSTEAIKLEGSVEITVGRDDTNVKIRFKDSGKGISEEALAKIFEPNFKTKDGRITTGWGLFIARQIVNSYGGEIRIDSTEGIGTTTEVILPLGSGGV